MVKICLTGLNYKIETSKENQETFDKTFEKLKSELSERQAFLLAIRRILGEKVKK